MVNVHSLKRLNSYYHRQWMRTIAKVSHTTSNEKQFNQLEDAKKSSCKKAEVVARVKQLNEEYGKE